MKQEQDFIKEAAAYEILELAAKYYAEATANNEHEIGYTVQELIDAGTEAEIPDEYIQQAMRDLKANKQHNQSNSEKVKVSFNLGVIISLILISLGAVYLLKDNLFFANSQNESANVVEITPQSKVQLKVLGDTFSGYSTLRNLKFQNTLKKQNIQLNYANEFVQQARAKAINTGKTDLIVTTLDQYLTHQPQGKIVGLIDRTIGADAIVFNNKAYPQLNSLLDLEALIEQKANQGKWLKIVYAVDTPSEFLAQVLDTKFDNFQLSNLEIVEVEDSSIAWETMQQDDEVALGVLWQPFIAQAESQGNTVALSSDDAPKTIVDIIVASDRILANNPQAVTDFITTYYRIIDSTLQDSSLLLHQIAIDGKMNPQEAKAVQEGIKFFSSLEAQQWMDSGILTQRIKAISSILTLTGKLESIPTDIDNLFTTKHLIPAVERTNSLIANIAVDNPELAKKLGGKETEVVQPNISQSQLLKAQDIGNLTVKGEIKFQTGSAILTTESISTLDKLIAEIAEFNPQNIAIQVKGHTSKTGSAAINNKLSQQRAEVVAAKLKQRNLPHQIVAEGLGFTVPLSRIPAESSLNQRTEIRLVRIK
ncbi:MAG: OmpA family protein [Cyanobacteria bacterium J06621_8]